jgi:N-acetylmuramic acid 6-phosphate etherase
MVDLQSWSAKLVDRGERIVMEVTQADRAAARAALDAAGGSARTAIVMIAKRLDAAAARTLLAQHDHRLRPILGDPPPVAGA